MKNSAHCHFLRSMYLYNIRKNSSSDACTRIFNYKRQIIINFFFFGRKIRGKCHLNEFCVVNEWMGIMFFFVNIASIVYFRWYLKIILMATNNWTDFLCCFCFDSFTVYGDFLLNFTDFRKIFMSKISVEIFFCLE